MANIEEFLTDLSQTPPPDFTLSVSTKFGPYLSDRLPFPHAIPLYTAADSQIHKQTSLTIALVGLYKRRSEELYRQAIDHATHTYNFAHFLDLSERDINLIYTQSLVQGIGKAFFLKLAQAPRQLTPSESAELRKHSILSFLILRKFNFPDIIAYGGLYHHVSYSKAFGYPNPEEDIQNEVVDVAEEFGLEQHVPSVVLPNGLPHSYWQLYSIVNLMNALTAAIDETKPYKKPLELSEVIKDFESYWTEWYNPDLREAFHKYVNWLANNY